jgi:hypothetical protein
VQEERQEVCGDIQDIHLVEQGQDEVERYSHGEASPRCRRARLVLWLFGVRVWEHVTPETTAPLWFGGYWLVDLFVEIMKSTSGYEVVGEITISRVDEEAMSRVSVDIKIPVNTSLSLPPFTFRFILATTDLSCVYFELLVCSCNCYILFSLKLLVHLAELILFRIYAWKVFV